MPSFADPVRMLIPGEFAYWSTGAGLAQGFRELGWDVGEVVIGDHLIGGHSLPLRIVQRLLGPLSKRSYNEAILRAADELKPQLMLTVKGNYIARQTLHALRSRGIATVNFYPDYKFEYEGFDPAIFGDYDQTITSKSFQLDHLRERFGADRISMVHHGYVPLAHRRRTPPGAEPDYQWDIAFVGNASPNKRDWLIEIARRFPERRMIIVGNRWPALARGTPIEPMILGHGLTGEYYARVIEHSRINIAIHQGKAGAQNWEDLVSTRSFEIPACGGFMLHIDNPEIRSLFAVPDEIDTFATPAELGDKIAYYLERPEIRRAMIERAYARSVPAYGLSERAREIAGLLVERGVLAPGAAP